MILNKWMFWGIIIFTSAGTAALDLIFPPGDPEITKYIWIFFTSVGGIMMLYAWTRGLKK